MKLSLARLPFIGAYLQRRVEQRKSQERRNYIVDVPGPVGPDEENAIKRFRREDGKKSSSPIVQIFSKDELLILASPATIRILKAKYPLLRFSENVVYELI